MTEVERPEDIEDHHYIGKALEISLGITLEDMTSTGEWLLSYRGRGDDNGAVHFERKGEDWLLVVHDFQSDLNYKFHVDFRLEEVK